MNSPTQNGTIGFDPRPSGSKKFGPKKRVLQHGGVIFCWLPLKSTRGSAYFAGLPLTAQEGSIPNGVPFCTRGNLESKTTHEAALTPDVFRKTTLGLRQAKVAKEIRNLLRKNGAEPVFFSPFSFFFLFLFYSLFELRNLLPSVRWVSSGP